jgi:hypothetical protein
MRIFENASKVNFVDENDVLVGLDSFQSCCEDWGHKFSKTSDGDEILNPEDLEDYFFDKDFFEVRDDDDSGGEAIFKLYACEGRELFLTLYNHHNGYYSHGFTMEVGGTVLRSGNI